MAQNSLDSAFCKKCGTTLPADDLQQAREKLDATVADGYKIFSAGRTDEAVQIAEMAVLANPLSTAALSLKAMCHERLGQISEALECHEKVLAIDPDSMIDKIKANDLRNLLVTRSSIGPASNRTPLVFAVAVFILFISIGVVIAKSGSRSADQVASNVPNTAQGAPTTHFEPTGATPPNTQNPTSAQPNPSSASTPQPEQTKPAPASRDSGNERANLPKLDGNQLPRPGIDGTAPVTVKIENPNDLIRPGQNATAPTNKAAQTNADPPPTEDPGQNNTTPTKQDAPGIMDIRVVSGTGQSGSDSSDPKTHPNGVEALLRTARSQYQIQNYAAASNSYERALRAGANPASTNQRLAQCYEKLGRSSAAIEAYNRAISSFQADLDAGRGDKNRISTALDSCKQAVKVLGG